MVRVNRLRKMRKKGMSIRAIAEEVGMSYTGVRYHIKDIPIRSLTIKNTKRSSNEIPAPLPPSKKLSYLIGVIAGDGFIENKGRTYRLWITCSNDHPELIRQYEVLVRSLLPGNVSVRRRPTSACTDITLYNNHLPFLLGLRSGAKRHNDFPIPAWIFENDDYMIAYVRGLVETDGGVYHVFNNNNKHYISCSFTAKIKNIMSSFLHITRKFGFCFVEISSMRAQLARKDEVEKFLDVFSITKCRIYVKQ